MKTYITVQGDTFDRIAKLAYGMEKRMDRLIAANPALGSTVVFGAGTAVKLPELEDSADAAKTAPWRKNR